MNLLTVNITTGYLVKDKVMLFWMMNSSLSGPLGCKRKKNASKDMDKQHPAMQSGQSNISSW